MQVYDVGKGSQTVHLAREHDVARKKARKFVNFMDKIRVKNLCMIFTISSGKGSSPYENVCCKVIYVASVNHSMEIAKHTLIISGFYLFLSNNTLQYNIC